MGLVQEEVTERVIGATIEVHRVLGPGLLESAYEECLTSRGIPFEKQLPLPVVYKGLELDTAYRMDLVVENCVIIEVKCVAALLPIHEAQLLTYLRLSGHRVGLLINFNVVVLKEGIKRRII